MDKFYNKNIKEIMNYFNSDDSGLNKNRDYNQKKFGKNIIEEKQKKSILKIFFSQFKDMLVIILVICAIVSIFLNELESTIVIFFVLTINALLGTYQYQKAQKSLNGLKNLSSPVVYIKKNNEICKIKSYELVCGDIVIINTGDIISADGRIIEEEGLEINESSLTGESNPIKKNNKIIDSKNLEISEQKNMVFSGTFCTKGHGKYIVCSVGMNSKIGEIAKKLNTIENKKTPLQNNLDNFSKYLSLIILVICFIVFLINIYRRVTFLDSLMFAVALAVAAIPEALSTIVTIVLAIGTEKMAKENAIIKDLKSVESLGCISVICTDKTGTLTTNNMVVIEQENIIEIRNFKRNVFLSTNYDMYLTSNNPTETALINYSKEFININYNKIMELSFSSDRKIMSNLYNIDDGNFMFCKGGIDVILSKCKYYANDSNYLSNEYKLDIMNKVNTYANKGRRVIGFGYKKINKNIIHENDECDLVYIGFVTIMDPPRKETKNAVKDCINAGIKPIMLTGDYSNTAVSIASDLGIYKKGDKCLTGKQLDNMSQKQLENDIENISVYARLNPSQKIRIVEAWQSKNKVVAMTGDGVNDALALAKADVSIAMGNGTEVAKDASSMILIDNNFSTIIKSISNGRKIFLNIQNAIRFLISGNLAAILIVLLTSFLNLPIPFLAIHLLFINLLTDSFPAIAIGMQQYKENLLDRGPRSKKEHFVSKRLVGKILLEGLLIFYFCFCGYLEGLKINVMTARTLAFTILCLSRLFHSFNCATRKCIFLEDKINKFLIMSFVFGVILINSVLFIPFMKDIFIISELNLHLVLVIYGYSILPTLIIQFIKLFK